MKDFSSIKAGDKLMTTGRQFGYGGWGPSSKFAMKEWLELEVEKVTPKFYFVDGEKFPKAGNGAHFMRRHYIPGQGGSPEQGNTEDFERRFELYKKLQGLIPSAYAKLERLTLESAAVFADRIKQLDEEIDAAVADAGVEESNE